MKTHLLVLLQLALIVTSCQTTDRTKEDSEVEVVVENLYGGTGGLSVDREGNIYSSDFGPYLGRVPGLPLASKVFRITPDGKVSIFADSLVGASGSDFDSEGNLYQSNIGAGVITKIKPDGTKAVYSNDSIVAPVGVLATNNNELVVCNCGNNTLRKISPEGKSNLFSKSDLFKCPNGIASDDAGNFYVSNFFDSTVVKVTSAGEASVFVKIPGNNNGHLNYKDGYLYVVARGNHQIYKVSLEGEVTLFAGSGRRGRKNGDRLTASFNYPNDLDFSPDGKYMYVNEEADTLSPHQVLTPTVIRRIRME